MSSRRQSSTHDSENVKKGLSSKTDVDREGLMMKKVVFGSEDFRYKSKEGRVDVEIVSVTTEAEEEEKVSTKTDVTTDFQVYQIPSVESSAKLPVRNQETDILAKRCILGVSVYMTFSVIVEHEMSCGRHPASHQIS